MTRDSAAASLSLILLVSCASPVAAQPRLTQAPSDPRLDRLARTAEDYLDGLKTLDLQDDVAVRELDRTGKEIGRAGGSYRIEFGGLSDHPIDGRWKLSNGDTFASNLNGSIELLAQVFLDEYQKGFNFRLAPDPSDPRFLRVLFEPANGIPPERSSGRFSAPAKGSLLADAVTLQPITLFVEMLSLPLTVHHHWLLSYKVQSVAFETDFVQQRSPAPGQHNLLVPLSATSRMVTTRGTFVVEHKYTVLPRRPAPN